MRERIIRFMQGRNGIDELAQAELVAVIILMIAGIFFRPVNILSTVLFVHTYFRVLSRNLAVRYKENQIWRNFRYKLAVRRGRLKKRRAEHGVYRYYHCPGCRQEVRVPSGHGRVCITCPKCRREFIKRTGKARG